MQRTGRGAEIGKVVRLADCCADEIYACTTVRKCLERDTREVKDHFLAKLPLAKWEGKNVLRFERETHVTRDKIVYVRECYHSLYRKVLDEVCKGGKCLITGTPGIGKSFFAYFAVRKLLDDGFTVIHIDQGWDWTNLYIPDTPSSRVREILETHGELPVTGHWMGRFKGASHGLHQPDSRNLYDALAALIGEVVVVVDPPNNFGSDVFVNPECGLLVVVAPSLQRIAPFTKSGSMVTLYMPIWSETELRTLLEKRKGVPLFDSEENELGLRVLQFGGVPRFVARWDSNHAEMISRAEDAIKLVFERLESPSMPDMFNPFHECPQFSGRIVHLLATTDFQLAGKRFATEMIERRICARYWRRSRQAYLDIMSAASGTASFFKTVENLSEVWWRVALQEGGPVKLIRVEHTPSKGATKTRPARDVIMPSIASRYSAKQNLADTTSLWNLEKAAQGIYVHFPKGNVPLIDSISVLDGDIAQAILDFESSSPFSPASDVPGDLPYPSWSTTSTTQVKRSRLGSSASTACQASTSSTSKMSGAKTKLACVLLNKMVTSHEHHFSWVALAELIELIRPLCPPRTSLHFCWVTSESIARNFQFTFPPQTESNSAVQIPQWLLILPDETLVRFKI